MTDGSVLLALAAIGMSAAVAGVALQLRGLWVCGSLLTLAGTVAVVSAFLGAAGNVDAEGFAIVAAAGLLAPLAVTSYPRLRWRHPADFVALATVAGAGALASVQWRDASVVSTMGLAIGLTLIAHIWWRIERGSGAERWRLAWLTLGVGVPGLVVGLFMFVAPGTTVASVSLAMFVLLGPAMVVGVTRPEVVDVRGQVVHAVVFALAGVVYLALFVTLESLVEILSGSRPVVGGAAVIGLLAAVTFRPTQVMLRGVVDELLFGRRLDPLDAAATVVSSIGDDPVAALGAVRDALALPYAAVTMDGVRLAESGVEATYTQTLTFEMGDGKRCALVVGLRAGDLRLSGDDEHVLRLVAPLLAQTLRASELAADLQVSREQTITALEEERLRLRRDLHDGLGPRLTGIAFTADAARNTLRAGGGDADALLAAVRAETGVAIEEIRRLVYAMRPPALDELGLIPALRQQAAALRGAKGDPLRVTITAGPMPEVVSAAVEVAAYRIVMEALTNVARHSGSDTASVCLHGDDVALVVDVTDSGGGRGSWSPGVGITSMRERAVQLRGTLTAGSGPAGGYVHAVLPLPTD